MRLLSFWLLLLLLRLLAMLATVEKMETAMERKAIWERETALESAVEGHGSLPPVGMSQL